MAATPPPTSKEKRPDESVGKQIHNSGRRQGSSENWQDVKEGPKFGLEPVLSPPESLTLVEKVAEKLAEGRQAKVYHRMCGFTSIIRETRTGWSNYYLSWFYRRAGVTCHAIRQSTYCGVTDWHVLQKANEAIEKNFGLVNINLKKISDRAQDLCEHRALTQLAGRVGKAGGTHLKKYFSTKTLKEACPFRAIVTEKKSWQRQVS